ncbi:MAG: hypothetical protein ACYTG4_16620, partial [Planctomycetota bacterium]
MSQESHLVGNIGIGEISIGPTTGVLLAGGLTSTPTLAGAQDGSLCVGGTPAEVAGLTLEPAVIFPVSRLAWSPHPAAVSYEIYRAGSPVAASFSSFASGVGLTELEDDGAVPAQGAVLYYLVVADTCAGPSSAVLDSEGLEHLL